MSTRFRIHVRKVDRDEFTAYKWGTIDSDGTVSTTDEGASKFGSLEEYVHQILPEAYRGEPLSLQIVRFWLERGRSYGTYAQRIKATVEHPLLDRRLAYPEFDLASVLHALDHPDSDCETVHEMTQSTPFGSDPDSDAGEREHRVATVMFSVSKRADAEEAVAIAMNHVFDHLHPQETRNQTYDRRLPDDYVFRVTQYARPVARVRVSRTSLQSAALEGETAPSSLADEWEIVA